MYHNVQFTLIVQFLLESSTRPFHNLLICCHVRRIFSSFFVVFIQVFVFHWYWYCFIYLDHIHISSPRTWSTMWIHWTLNTISTYTFALSAHKECKIHNWWINLLYLQRVPGLKWCFKIGYLRISLPLFPLDFLLEQIKWHI
jgi:hypothetical protein